MKFKIHRRKGKFGKGNFRNENHGKEKVPAADLPITFDGGKRELDMLAPLIGDLKFSDVIYDEKGNLLMPYLSPMSIHRKPDNVTFRCWDNPTNAKNVLEFDGCTVKSIVATLKNKRNLIITLTVQLHDDPDKHTARLRKIMDKEYEFELEAQQEDFFDTDPEDAPKDKKGAKQPELALESGDDDEGEEDDE